MTDASKNSVVWTECHQGSDEWRAARLGKITGSRFADVMTKGRAGEQFGKTAESYAYDIIIERLTGQPRDEITAKEMEWGKANEDAARLAYCFATGNQIDKVGFGVHGVIHQVGVSSDGLVNDDGCIEIKCPYNSKYHLNNLLHRKVPREYKPQIQGAMWVLERKWCDFVSYDPRMPAGKEISIVRVDRDEEAIAELEERCRLFVAYIELLALRLDQAADTMAGEYSDR